MTLRSTFSAPTCRALRQPIVKIGRLHSIPLALTLFAALPLSASAQLSLSSAVDLALHSNPRVRSAEDDVKKAQAQLSEVHDAYVPAITAGGGVGEAYGYSPNPPELATVSGGSLVFSASQSDYIRSARSGLKAAELAVDDVHEAVAEDTALAFIALDHDQQRAQAIAQQDTFAASLVTIVEQRLDAGQDSQIDLTEAKLTSAQLHLASMKAQDDIAYDREHLARLIGLPADSLTIDNDFPTTALPPDESGNTSGNRYANPAVAAAFASAQARKQQADGLARYRFWPEINLVAQYNRYATFTESFTQLQQIYTITDPVTGLSRSLLTANEGAFGIQISLPVLDRGRSAKARQASAEADKFFHDAQTAEIEALDGTSRIRHDLDELRGQSDVATLQQQLAQQQLDIIQLQINSGNGNPNAPQMSPKDQQKARIAERDKYLAVIDANYQLREAEIQLLRQTGDLESWLESSITTQSPAQH
jgi:outer membrane protein TolC